MPSLKAGQPRVLIIDDDRDFFESTAAILARHGYAVEHATNGADGIACVKRECPDLIILDVMMENAFAGYEVNQTLKWCCDAKTRAVPILMVSSIPVDPATRFARAGEVEMITPDCYLTKPLDLDRFIKTVQDLARPGGCQAAH